MNSNALGKLYDRLAPRERLPLIVAASLRGDEAERGRLMRSAPTDLYRLPDYHGLADALHQLALLHLLEVLDLVATFRHAQGLVEQYALLEEEEDEERDGRRMRTVRFAAYLITAKLDAWRQLFGGLNIDSEVLVQDLPGYATVRRAEEGARVLALTVEEATDYIRSMEGGEAVAPTAEAYLAGLRAFVEARSRWWG